MFEHREQVIFMLHRVPQGLTGLRDIEVRPNERLQSIWQLLVVHGPLSDLVEHWLVERVVLTFALARRLVVTLSLRRRRRKSWCLSGCKRRKL